MLVEGEGAPFGVDIATGGIADSFANFVWEPAVVKVTHIYLRGLHSNSNVLYGWCLSKLINLQINAINAATEAACLVLSVDETVKNPKVNI
jgi:T-complex protein 1 subunit eta